MPYYNFFILILMFSPDLYSVESEGYKYNTYINKAELAITENGFTEALKMYEYAFASTKIEFSVDLYNACVCAIKLNDTNKVIFFADKLAARGVGKNFFSKKIFQNYVSTKSFLQILAKAEKVRTANIERNKTYVKSMDGFFSRDSLYNKIRIVKYSNYEKLPDSLETLFHENTTNMLDFIVKNGYYSENKMGADVIDDTIIRTKSKPDIVLLHYLEMGSNRATAIAIKNMLLDNLNRGNIKQSNISSTIEMTNGLFGYTGSFLFNIIDCKIYKNNDQTDLAEINHNRNLYCMDNIDDFERKVIFKYSNISDFDFRYAIIRTPVHDKKYFNESFQPIATIINCNK